MLTALRSEAQERISYEIGVDEYLCKPFDEVILRLRIRNILALRQKYKSMFSTSMNCETLNINASSKDNTFMTSAINLMKEHYADSDYNLERFIRDMGYSKTLVNQKLQSLTGQSIGQFMRNYRLNVAKDTLTKVECDISVAEIAYAVGFNDPKYFTKCFKELFGVLPSEYFGKKTSSYSICAPYSPIKSFVSLTFVKNRNANVYEKHILIIELADITPLRYTGKPHQGNAGKDRQGEHRTSS